MFFKRLHFTLDCLLELITYEQYGIFSNGQTPTADYNKIISKLEITVNDFIDRSIHAELESIGKLKTEKSKKSRLEKYYNSTLEALMHPNSFWEGSWTSAGMLPHYADKLCTPNNISYFEEKVAELKGSLNV